MANSWSIKIVKGNPCTFDPDVYCPPGTTKPTVLNAQANDSISWDNQTDEEHQICTDPNPTPLTNVIPAYGSSDAFSPQTTGTINYYCCKHSGEKGTIEVAS